MSQSGLFELLEGGPKADRKLALIPRRSATGAIVARAVIALVIGVVDQGTRVRATWSLHHLMALLFQSISGIARDRLLHDQFVG